jgi:hypothetical protein
MGRIVFLLLLLLLLYRCCYYCLVFKVVVNKKVTTGAGVAECGSWASGRWESVTGHLFASVSLVLLSPNLPKMIGGAGQKKVSCEFTLNNV